MTIIQYIYTLFLLRKVELTIGYKTIKAANMNPVDSLRDE